MKKIKIRAILDFEQDVFRDIEMNKNTTLIELHHALKSAFNFTNDEMASFYYTDEYWNQGSEIPIEDMFENGVLTMQDVPMESVFKKKGDKLIYIFDFLSLWTFFIEMVDETEGENPEAETVFTYGVMPEQAPEKNMIAENLKEQDDFGLEEYNDNWN